MIDFARLRHGVRQRYEQGALSVCVAPKGMSEWRLASTYSDDERSQQGVRKAHYCIGNMAPTARLYPIVQPSMAQQIDQTTLRAGVVSAKMGLHASSPRSE
jgi:hypothetical protein